MIDGKLPYYMIYQDDDCLVILDRYPIDNGHSLIITKKHYEKIKLFRNHGLKNRDYKDFLVESRYGRRVRKIYKNLRRRISHNV